MNEEKKNNGRGIFYGVIGVATLVVAIIGATFAYFTATGNDNGTITGNMATITFSLNVTKVTHIDETKGGMIPMSNNMVEQGVLDTGSGNAAQTCVDDNGNAVCQIYKIVVTNTGSASLFVDGYVKLSGGSGEATDVANADTTMRWAQVFCTGTSETEITGCTTAGRTTTGAGAAVSPETAVASGITEDWDALGNASDSTGFDATKILNTFAAATAKGSIAGNNYDIINTNYIRSSQRAANAGSTFPDRTDDVASALVFNQNLAPASDATNSTKTLYIVVWLSETGTNQTASATGAGTPEESGNGLSFFSGEVVFNSAQGSEVTATFSGYSAVPSDQRTGQTGNNG